MRCSEDCVPAFSATSNVMRAPVLVKDTDAMPGTASKAVATSACVVIVTVRSSAACRPVTIVVSGIGVDSTSSSLDCRSLVDGPTSVAPAAWRSAAPPPDVALGASDAIQLPTKGIGANGLPSTWTSPSPATVRTAALPIRGTTVSIRPTAVLSAVNELARTTFDTFGVVAAAKVRTYGPVPVMAVGATLTPLVSAAKLLVVRAPFVCEEYSGSLKVIVSDV